MNIAFDATAILGPGSRNRGIGNYNVAQFNEILKQDKENQYFCINYFDVSIFGEETKNYNNLTEEMLWCGEDLFLSRSPDYIEVFGDMIKHFILRNEIDVFYITSPFDGHVFSYKKEWFADAKVMVMVYDIIPLLMIDDYLNNYNTLRDYLNRTEVFLFADKILTISECAKHDVSKVIGVDENKIDVIYGAPSDMYKKIHINDNEREELFSKFDIIDEFIFCSAGDDRRKNVDGVISAYFKLPKELIEKYQLVVTCSLTPENLKRHNEMVTNLQLESRVIFTNFVEAQELIYLYNLATIMVFPSKYEGFGLPVVEAFACGTPVLTSNNSSLGEIAGDAAATIDPFNIDDIARGMEELLTTSNLEDYVNKGYERNKLFQWSEVAIKTIKAINSVQVDKAQTGNLVEKQKIAIFTPLSSAESAILDHSVDIILGICKYFDVDIYIEDGSDANYSLPENANVYNHNMFNKKKKQYFRIIYQLGDSLYYTYMHQYIKENGGIAILHDYNMHSAVYSYSTKVMDNDINLYKEYLLEDYSRSLVDKYIDAYRERLLSPMLCDIEVNGFVLNYIDSVIVHSDKLKYKLLKKNIKNNVHMIKHNNECDFDIEMMGKQYYGIIMNKWSDTLSNEVLLKIVVNELEQCKFTDCETRKISKTLAMSKVTNVTNWGREICIK